MIYQRQKVLLNLLREAPNRSASKIPFVKWLFLLKEEENIDQRISFYSFFPYNYGPFSFLAYKDIFELERFGWVKSDYSSFRYAVSEEESVGIELPSETMQSVERILQNYGRLSPRSLMKYVYDKYPWYASKSRFKQSSPPVVLPKAQPAIYSLGYEGLSIDAFLDIVLKVGIQAIIDVRNNPVSRKYSFSKSALADKCRSVGLKYHQFSDIGIPPKFRSHIQNKQALWKFYIEEVIQKNLGLLRSIASICESRPSALICFEKNPEDCHRHIVAGELSTMTDLPIVHCVEGRWKKNGTENKDSYSCQDISHTVKQI